MSTNTDMVTITTDVLIIGAGPSGASLACFLAFYGVEGMILSRDPSTALQPRAHYTNPGAWECLRDIGLESEWRKVCVGREFYGDHRHCNTMVGKDYARMYGFGRHPSVLGDYETVSPCTHAEVGQNVGEPILVKYATQNGFKMRFDCKFLSYEIDQASGQITSIILDQVTGSSFKIISKYLCGADGASSAVARQAELPFHTLSGGGSALNIWYEADLTHLHKPGDGMMHSLLTPEIESPDWAPWGLNRAMRPYTEFVISIAARPGVSNTDISEEAVVKRLRELIGDPKIEIKIKGIYRWRINESYAETISKDSKIFCLGDAIHRHPPGNGLGSNTCIQDAYNLAWKIAYVLQGKAGSGLLDSYDAERQPVAKRIVRIANDALRTFAAFYKAIGVMEPTLEARKAAIKQLEEASPEGAARRQAVKEANERTRAEKAGLGGEMNQAYDSRAIYRHDEPASHPGWEEGDAGTRHHLVNTYPGSRLPHAWLIPYESNRRVSTHDLAGKGNFTIFTGIGGKGGWQSAANAAKLALDNGIEIVVRSIGYGQDFTDMYGMWEERRGVEEDGAVLVRPDRSVAWRSQTLGEDGKIQLVTVMRNILALNDDIDTTIA